MTPDEIAGTTEVAQMLGVNRRTVYRYLERDDFPAPIGELARGRVWRRADVEKWAKKNLPLRTGRPPKQRDA